MPILVGVGPDICLSDAVPSRNQTIIHDDNILVIVAGKIGERRLQFEAIPDNTTIYFLWLRHAAVTEAATLAACEAKILDTWEWGGRIFDRALVNLVRRKAQELGYSHRDLPSQAGHDAYFMTRICPTTMIFTPCKDGITHNNAEFTTKEEISPGFDVLMHSVVAQADRG
ncbi:M20/M25/M40 family metallo-hydrolase [Mesorhizobium cantuariense]|uniref:M20/M25/M40 family metallo-hydrolase n=1 Tax=Mesorhizobium cantuariense TaxID=1300275 RepID=A0ABV7MQL5_9HYPH